MNSEVERQGCRWIVQGLCSVCLAVSLGVSLQAQSGVLFINEVVSENDNLEPTDLGGGHPDMVELFNAGNESLVLGQRDAKDSYYLSDTAVFLPEEAWRFPNETAIPPGGHLVVFCDDDPLQGICELHALFRVNNNGNEPVSLWGPADDQGIRPLVDQVWMPPMRADVSFGRFPDGAGPAPVSIEETLSVFHFTPAEMTSFGSCINTGVTCSGAIMRRLCLGAENNEGQNLEPRVSRLTHTSNHPDPDEPVEFTVRVEDDKEPTPGNIASVLIRYSVNGVDQEPVELQYDESTGILDGSDREPPRPLERWSVWRGAIPGLPAGSRVSFEFYVEDMEGLSSVNPRNQCPDGVGPCDDLGLPGPGCVKEEDDLGMEGLQFVSCDLRRQYVVGYEVPALWERLVINEVVPVQTRILVDLSEPRCDVDGSLFCRHDDFMELCNGSDAAIDISGLWLSDRPFHPRGWQFPAGSILPSQSYTIVWLDNDGGKCPDPDGKVPGDGQECPDPTDPEIGEYHANFEIDRNGDQIYLFAELPDDGGFGVVHGFEFGITQTDFSWSLTPDCDRNGEFLPVPDGSPLSENPSDPPSVFLRGDANADCSLNITDATYLLNFLFLSGPTPPCADGADVDDTGDLVITDAVYLLNFLFLEGPVPPSPGGETAGVDPTEDELPICDTPGCSG